ncbi:hypothetical protein [Mumia sp. DW29H23]|uniref:hypothetical protein n=1 Tax=Mumia sp. DW29H23 TaxID=3421241 RepID=UPI003D692C45
MDGTAQRVVDSWPLLAGQLRYALVAEKEEILAMQWHSASFRKRGTADSFYVFGVTVDALDREWQLLAKADPAARAALAAEDPDSAYQAIFWSRNDLLEDPEMPHAGDLYCAWAELEDLYEIGRSAPEQFHTLARTAAASWLARPSAQSSDWIQTWVNETREAIAALFRRDGTILDEKPR